MTAIATESQLQKLHRRFRGALVAPGDYAWETATQAFNLTFRQEPDLVAVPADEEDVVTIVNYARENGLQIAPQRTGHNAEPLGDLEGVVLLKTDGLQGVSSTPSGASPASPAAPSGTTSCRRPPSSGLRLCTARRPT